MENTITNAEIEHEETTNAEPEEKIGYRDILHQKEYLKVITANLVTRFGDSIDAIAFTWMVYAITGSAAWSAIIFAMNQLPSVLVQPFAGALVEGMNKKKIMVITDIIRGSITAGLAVLYLTGNVNAWILLFFTLINSSVEAFCSPASLAVIPKIMDQKYYAFGSALNSTLSTTIQLIGIGAAGFIISIFGIGTAIAIDGISFFGSAIILSFLKIKETNLRKENLNIKEYGTTLMEGIKYLKGQPVIRNFCIMGVLINAACVPLNALQSPLVSEIMGQGSELLSVFSIALMIGMGVGSFIFPFLNRKISVRTLVVISGLFVGIGFYLYTFGTMLQSHVVAIYALTIGVTAILGIASSMIGAVLGVQFMKCVQQDYLARVGAIFNAGACAASPVTSLAVGALITVIPIASMFKICAVIFVVIFLFIAIRKVRLE